MMIFETERLIIREIIESDIDGFYELHSSKKVMDSIPAETSDFRESKEEIKRIIKRQLDPESKINVYAVIFKSRKEFVGTCALINVSNEIGCRIHEKFWRQGIGTEVTKGMINFSFKNSKTQKIIADVDSKNVGSIKILTKFMDRISESTDEKDNSIEIRFELEKVNWSQQCA